MATTGKASRPVSDIVPVLRNKRASYDYEMVRRLEAGLVLSGTEVKSLRAGDVQLGDAHARFDHRGELWLHGLHIGEWRHAGPYFQHQATARRKLLLNAAELRQLVGTMQQKGLSLILASLYFKRGRAKAELLLGRGRRKGDKRAVLMAKAKNRDVERELARRARGR